MFLFAPFSKLYSGPVSSKQNDEEESESEHSESESELAKEDAIEVPQVRTGITERSRPTTSNSGRNATMEYPDETGTEVYEGIGQITAFDPSMKKGVINRQYQFDTEQFCNGKEKFRKDSQVKFRAEREGTRHQWTVTSMKLEKSPMQKVKKEKQCRFTKVKGIVRGFGEDYVKVEVMDEKFKGPRMIRVPNALKPSVNVPFEWIPGDVMQLELDKDYDAISTIPNMTTVVEKVTKRGNNFFVDDRIHFTQAMFNYEFRVDAVVKCTAIETNQKIGNETMYWRAIKMEKDKFLFYNDEKALQSSKDVGYVDDIGTMAEKEYEILLNDKFGVRIYPKQLFFPPQMIGTDSMKTLTVKNGSGNIFHLEGIRFNEDTAICQFTARPRMRAQDREREGNDLVLYPGDELVLEITCRPKFIGKTKEICEFDFGSFKIGRIFSAIGRSMDEQLLLPKHSNEGLPAFKKQIGKRDIEQIIINLERRRVRGQQAVRVPFFTPKRIVLNQIPPELFKITEDRDEEQLKKLYPTCLNPISFPIYETKFQVALWFEEIENDLRRRQYDLHQVQLGRHNGSPVSYTFIAPGIQEYQPPVNLQDTIDAFDEESPTNAKFQGTVMQIVGNEVTCIFGDAFINQYTGIPMTIQFNLSRTNYKRCHHAVQTAVTYLGEEFLFPGTEIRVKPARINVYESDSDKNAAVEVHATYYGKENANSSPISAFRKAAPAPVFTENRSTRSSNNDDIGKRAQSIRSRFVSDTPSVPSCSSAKLEWFNKSLNDEQKNAVRRILSGQARPVPYIIYGPPGTGKTVTLVEAVMQVNKLDENSRVLVCAPSNTAADIIAEYLANSAQYWPGDFVRLNGYLRNRQAMLENIGPFCIDGEDLGAVAMHRLIVSTCMTAGQFFSLDLSSGHFTHVFIDEAGYCTEPETMVPTILMALSKGGQLILAGDPNQLGPVLMSDVSQNCGLNKSLLERLMLRPLYSRDEEQFPEEKYNPLVLTKLVKNYRAHPTLLRLPSKLFYHGDLVSKASREEAYDLCQDPSMKGIVASQGVPLVFHGVQGLCTRDKDSPSWYNKAEVLQVVQYVEMLLGKRGLTYEDIGIITPYRKQVENIRYALEKRFHRTEDLPKVASVEEFQGGERKVIIISTVRSVNEDRVNMNGKFLERLSFLYQPKRFNVVVTRAKALMIVVGNPHVLEKNNYWLQLLKYAIELNAYKGCNLPIHLTSSLRAQGRNSHERALQGKAEMEKGPWKNGIEWKKELDRDIDIVDDYDDDEDDINF